MFKKLIIGAGLLGLGTVLWTGTEMRSYCQTAYGEAMTVFDGAVSPEFEIKRIKNKLADLGPEIKKQRREIALEEVKLQRLQNEVVEHQERLDKEKVVLLNLRDRLEENLVSYEINNMKWSRDSLENLVSRRFAAFKQSTDSLENKNEMLVSRTEAVQNAKIKYQLMIEKHGEFQARLESLAAKFKKLEAKKMVVNFDIDDTDFSKIVEDLKDLEDRIAVEETMAAQEGALDSSIYENELENVDTGLNTVGSEIDEYFQKKEAEGNVETSTEDAA